MLLEMMMRVMTSLILILSIFCSAAWAQATCRAGYFACGPGARQPCITGQWLCDGDNDCGNGNDEEPEMCANLDCPEGLLSCEGESLRRRCIPPHWFCDGYDACGNNWDENPAVCADVPCGPRYYQCPEGASRRCVPERWLCDGDNDCGDNTDEDPSVCRANGAFAAQLCMNIIFQQCLQPTGIFGMREQQLHQKLVNTELRELCGPVLEAQECATEVLASEACQMPDVDHPGVIEMQQTIVALNITVNHVCRDNVEVFDEHKECLLRRGRRGFVIFQSLDEQCPPQGAQPPCLPTELVDCAEGVVSQQCGQEIAGQLRTLGTKVMTELGCETQKRFEIKKKEMRMHRVFAAKKLMKKKTYSPLELMQKAFHTLF